MDPGTKEGCCWLGLCPSEGRLVGLDVEDGEANAAMKWGSSSLDRGFSPTPLAQAQDKTLVQTPPLCIRGSWHKPE